MSRLLLLLSLLAVASGQLPTGSFLDPTDERIINEPRLDRLSCSLPPPKAVCMGWSHRPNPIVDNECIKQDDCQVEVTIWANPEQNKDQYPYRMAVYAPLRLDGKFETPNIQVIISTKELPADLTLSLPNYHSMKMERTYENFAEGIRTSVLANGRKVTNIAFDRNKSRLLYKRLPGKTPSFTSYFLWYLPHEFRYKDQVVDLKKDWMWVTVIVQKDEFFEKKWVKTIPVTTMTSGPILFSDARIQPTLYPVMDPAFYPIPVERFEDRHLCQQPGTFCLGSKLSRVNPNILHHCLTSHDCDVQLIITPSGKPDMPWRMVVYGPMTYDPTKSEDKHPYELPNLEVWLSKNDIQVDLLTKSDFAPIVGHYFIKLMRASDNFVDNIHCSVNFYNDRQQLMTVKNGVSLNRDVSGLIFKRSPYNPPLTSIFQLFLPNSYEYRKGQFINLKDDQIWVYLVVKKDRFTRVGKYAFKAIATHPVTVLASPIVRSSKAPTSAPKVITKATISPVLPTIEVPLNTERPKESNVPTQTPDEPTETPETATKTPETATELQEESTQMPKDPTEIPEEPTNSEETIDQNGLVTTRTKLKISRKKSRPLAVIIGGFMLLAIIVIGLIFWCVMKQKPAANSRIVTTSAKDRSELIQGSVTDSEVKAF